MIEHPAVRKVNFTGSTAVGRKIARACGQNLKPCLMELGGKNSSIICADADLTTAVQGVLAGAFLNVSSPCHTPWCIPSLTESSVWPNLHGHRPHPRPLLHRSHFHRSP